MGRVGWLMMGAVLLLLGTGLIVVLAGKYGGAPSGTPLTTRPVAASADFFTDVTAASGVDFIYRNGQEADHYAILESLGGGVALLDYDGDGLLDLFLPGGGFFDGSDKKDIKGHPCKLYRNLGGWKFQDVTREAGLDGIGFYSHGAAVADYDRDGWPDLLVTGYGRLALFHNVADSKGGRRFVEVTKEAGLLGPHLWSTSAGWADLDGDGYPDLYVCQYVDWSFTNNPPCNGYTTDIDRDICPPAQFDSRPHALYRNRGDGTFLDVSKEAGLRFPRKPEDYGQLDYLSREARERLEQTDHDRDYGKGLGVLLVDINGDGKPDMYVANDTTDKFLYVNRSVPGKLRFEEQGNLLGVARDDRGVPNGSMGLDAGDYDGSGRPSLLVTNYENESHALYRNVTAGDKPVFRYSSMTAGLTSIGRQYVGFGTGFLDVDGDGWEDIVFANGHVIRHPTRSKVQQAPVLLRNLGRQENSPHVRFTVATAQGGEYFRGEHQARGLAIGDLDNDGRPDLVISHVNAPAVLLRNVAGAGPHWLGVELVGRAHADVVGAKVTLEAGGRRQTRFAKGGGSYLSSGDRRLLFGLGGVAEAGRLTVVWPSGEEQHWDGLGMDHYWRLVAGESAAQEARRVAGPPIVP